MVGKISCWIAPIVLRIDVRIALSTLMNNTSNSIILKYLFITLLLSLSFNAIAQEEDRKTWVEKIQDRIEKRQAKIEENSLIWSTRSKIKVDLLNILGDYPSIIFGFEYPINQSELSIEHEFGPIINLANSIKDVDRISGFKTSHTALLNNGPFSFGVGVHYRLLNLEGNLTACSQDEFNNCNYWRLFEDKVQSQRIAPYIRLRMNVPFNKVGVSFGMDIGRQFQKFLNDEFSSENLRLQDLRAFQIYDLNNRSTRYFRVIAQLMFKL